MSRNYSHFRGVIFISVNGYSQSGIPAQFYIKFRLFYSLFLKTIRFLFEGMSTRTFLLPACYLKRLVPMIQFSFRSLMCNSMKLIEIQKHILKITIEKPNKHEKSSYYFEKRSLCFCCSHFKPFSGNISFFPDYSA